MKKRLLFIVLIILTLSLSACNPGTPKENDVPDASASPETTPEVTKETDSSPTPETKDSTEFLWEGKEKDYEGDFSYLDLPLFRDNDIPTLRTACKVNKTDSVDGLAGGWVYCEELNEDLTYYDLKEVTSGLEEKAMNLIEDGYLTKETISFKDSLFYKYLNESTEYTPIPGIYNFSGQAPIPDIYSSGYAKREQGLEYLIYGNDTDRMSFGVIDIGEGYHILTVTYHIRESANTIATGEPKVKFDYYYSMAIVR